MTNPLTRKQQQTEALYASSKRYLASKHLAQATLKNAFFRKPLLAPLRKTNSELYPTDPHENDRLGSRSPSGDHRFLLVGEVFTRQYRYHNLGVRWVTMSDYYTPVKGETQK